MLSRRIDGWALLFRYAASSSAPVPRGHQVDHRLLQGVLRVGRRTLDRRVQLGHHRHPDASPSDDQPRPALRALSTFHGGIPSCDASA